jgi:hypothetical protein
MTSINIDHHDIDGYADDKNDEFLVPPLLEEEELKRLVNVLFSVLALSATSMIYSIFFLALLNTNRK